MMVDSSEKQRILQEYGSEDDATLRFIRAMEDGVQCWFYLRVPQERLPAYIEALASGALVIREYGRILESDTGNYPPDDVVRFMKKEYNCITPPLGE